MIIANLYFSISDCPNIVNFAQCLETGRVYDFKKSNEFYRLCACVNLD